MEHVEDRRPSHLSLDSSVERPGARGARPTALTTHLAPGDIEVLRSAIACSLCEGEMSEASDVAIDAELRKSIRLICAKARVQRVRAEHVLIDVKRIWTTIPQTVVARTNERLSEIVTACIDEYYAADISPAR